MSDFTPTDEQTHAIELALTGQSLALQAGAGTGKTATLKLIAEALAPRRGQYIAFNKAIVTEAGTKFPATVACNTAHSLAYRAIAAGTPFQQRQQQGKRMRSIEIANALKTEPLTVQAFDGNRKQLSRSFLASLAISGVQRFCQSADAEPTYRHVPYIEGIDAPGRYDANRAVAKQLEPALRRAWADLSSHHGALPFTKSTAMAVYLKLWQLSEPKIGADFILFDEAQDANPVMVAVVSAQTHAQLIWVGDSQQQIYAFTGAVNALDKVPADQRAFLTQSFRFGPAIAEVANSILSQIEGAELRLTGTETIASVVAPVAEPDAILCRTNATAVRTVLTLQAEGQRVHLAGDNADIVRFTKAARDLQNGLRVEHPELACFESWSEVQEYVEQDEQGGDLRLLVRLIDEFGVEVILAALDSNVKKAEDADVVVSTAHKSKGREWNSVQLAGDFSEEKMNQADEQRLLYVAVTRAQVELDIDALPFLRDGYTQTVTAVVATTGEKAREAVSVYGGDGFSYDFEQALQGRQEAAEAPATVEPTEEPQVEVTVEVTAPEASHYGTVGERVTLTLTVRSQAPTPGRFGGYATTLEDGDGHTFSWFADEVIEAGSRVTGSWKIKGHSEYRGVPETQLNYAAGVDVETPAAFNPEVTA